MMSVNITARKIAMSSGIVKNWGWNIPFLAISIIPPENVTPARIPKLAMIMITTNGAALEPIEEFRKFTASFATPTMMSKTAKIKSTTTAMNNISIPIIHILSNQDRSVNM
jgi:hypothetical protein